MDEQEFEQRVAMRNKHTNDEKTVDMPVSSLTDATILLMQHQGPKGAKIRRQLVQYITNPENRVLNEPDTYHNFIIDLCRLDDYDLALRVCDFVLQLAPQNRDMLADALHACASSSQFAEGEPYLARAMEIPKTLWSYRLFLYSIDFLQQKLDAYPTDEALYEQAIALADEFIAVFPYDEHGYNRKAELMVMMNRRVEAVETLQEFIFRTQPDKQDTNSCLVTAQCCVTLLNLLDDTNQYDEIIRVCERGLRNTTQEQPSSKIGFFVYRKALALDAKAHAEEFRIPATIADALRFYQSAYDLNQDRSYARTIEQRYAVLRPYAQNFQPLVKRPLYVEEKTESDD